MCFLSNGDILRVLMICALQPWSCYNLLLSRTFVYVCWTASGILFVFCGFYFFWGTLFILCCFCYSLFKITASLYDTIVHHSSHSTPLGESLASPEDVCWHETCWGGATRWRHTTIYSLGIDGHWSSMRWAIFFLYSAAVIQTPPSGVEWKLWWEDHTWMELWYP